MWAEKLIPFWGALLGAFVGAFISFYANQMFCIVVGIAVGIVIGIVIVLILNANNAEEDISYPSEKLTIPKLYKSYVNGIEFELKCRQYAARRLHTCEFWIQTLNIYYSCFTAAIAIWSITDLGESLSMPSAILTILVAILVTYANAQNCGNRARDLEANCRDIASTLTVFLLETDELSKDAIQSAMDKFYKKLGDSESPSNIDIWKSEKNVLYPLYLILVSILIITFFIAPFMIVIYREKLIEFLRLGPNS